MLRAKRDSIGGPQGSAVPSFGEIEGRVFVLRIVAMTALTRLLRRREHSGQSELIRALQHAVERKCAKAKLPLADIAASSEFAKNLFQEARDRTVASQY
jgi:hypothetical protein